ncbi:MAG TPA: CAP domain-containing protein [bacterium]|nr:CAP domain-containing protein [bacterium]
MRHSNIHILGKLSLFVAMAAAAATSLAAPPWASAQSTPDLGTVVIATGVRTAHTMFVPDAETALLALLNQTRRAHGLPPLTESSLLRAAARSHSREMTLLGFVGHGSWLLRSFLERLGTVVRAGTFVGENVTCATTVAQVESAFEASPGHLLNILNPRFHFVGVGIAAAPLGLMVTEDFAE